MTDAMRWQKLTVSTYIITSIITHPIGRYSIYIVSECIKGRVSEKNSLHILPNTVPARTINYTVLCTEIT
jgi:hypothetical protein